MIVCCFALHLVEEDRLFPLCTQAALSATYLFVVSPHKRPILSTTMGWQLIDEMVSRIHSNISSDS